MHRLDSGHFAVEDSLDEIATTMRRFYVQGVRNGGSRNVQDLHSAGQVTSLAPERV